MEGKMNAVYMTKPEAGAWEYVEDAPIPQIAAPAEADKVAIRTL